MNEELFGNSAEQSCTIPDESSETGRLETMSTRRVLVIDDQPHVARALAIALECAGFELESASGPEEAYSMFADRRFDAILLDLNFTQGKTAGDEGLTCLARILSHDPAAAVIVITAHSGIRIAVAAIKAGARDFITKPWRNTDLVDRVKSIVAQERSTSPIPTAASAQIGIGPARLIGEHPSMDYIRSLIRRIGPTAASVLISGQRGSGRGLVALALYEVSADIGRGMTIVDLRDPASWDLAPTLGGTCILRHLESLDDVAQERLASLLPADARLIGIVGPLANLNPALRARVGLIDIAIPPLESRGTDVLLLARHFVRQAAERHGRALPRLTTSAEAVLLSRTWQQGVRELAQSIERAVLLNDGAMLDGHFFTADPVLSESSPAENGGLPSFHLSQSERLMIEAALQEHRHSVTHAANALGLSRTALYRRMAKYGL